MNGQKFAYCGDLFPSVAHIPMPYIMSYDTKPLETLENKKRFFKDAIKDNYILIFDHDLYNECCTLKETEKGITVEKTFNLKSLFNN